MTKVSIVKWSQNCILWTEIPFLARPQIKKKKCLGNSYTKNRYARNDTSQHKSISETTIQYILWSYYYYKVTRIIILYYSFQNLQPPLKLYQLVRIMCFRNPSSIGFILGTYRTFRAH